jgi:hypothetical protein
LFLLEFLFSHGEITSKKALFDSSDNIHVSAKKSTGEITKKSLIAGKYGLTLNGNVKTGGERKSRLRLGRGGNGLKRILHGNELRGFRIVTFH